MQMNDQDVKASILTALDEVSVQEMSTLMLYGGKLEVDFESGRAMFQPGLLPGARPLPAVVVDPAASGYPISCITLSVPSFLTADEIATRMIRASRDGETQAELVHRRTTEGVALFIRRLRVIERSALKTLRKLSKQRVECDWSLQSDQAET